MRRDTGLPGQGSTHSEKDAEKQLETQAESAGEAPPRRANKGTCDAAAEPRRGPEPGGSEALGEAAN